MEVVRREPGYIRDGKLVTAFLAKTQKREKNRQYSIVRWGWLLVLGAVLVCAILASLLVSWWERRDMAKPLFPTETIAATVTRTPTPESTIALTRTPLPILASRLPILTTNPTFASPQVVQATSISASIPTPIPAAKHSPSSGDYKGEWYVAGTMPQSMDNHGAISLTSIVCAFGGWETTTSFCGMVDDSGYIEQWKWGGRFEQFCGNFAWTQVDETAFVLGGLRADSVTPQVLRADLGQARVLDDWQSLEPLPIALEYPSAASVGQHIYFIGGRVDRRPVQDVFQSDYKNEVNTPWERVAPLPVGLSGHTAVTLQGRIYVLGGRSSAGEGPLSDKVYVTQVEGDGSLTGWSEISSLPVPMGWHMAVVFEDAIFVMGGIRDDSEYSPEVYYALVDPTTGDLGEWVPYTSLPTPVANSAAIVAQGRIIMMGGWSGNGKLMEVYATQPVWLGTP
jgi:N-acetylneuraminic acid mutarotase